MLWRGEDAELFQRPAHRQVRLLDDADDLVFFGCGISHASSPPSPIILFLSRRSSRACSATTSFSSWAWRLRSLTSLPVAVRAVSPDSQALASLQELFRPAVVEALGNALATAEFGNAGFAAQPVEDDADFLLGGILLAGGPANISHEPLGPCFRGCGFLSHVHSSGGYDETEILRSSSR